VSSSALPCGSAFSLSRTTLVNGLDSSTVASFFLSVGLGSVVVYVFNVDTVGAVCKAPGSVDASWGSDDPGVAG
jgi:hypothetical protein